MASNDFILRCKTETGPFTLDSLTPNSTIGELKKAIENHAEMKPETMKLLSGFPPKVLMVENDAVKLKEVSILSGDTIIVERVAIAAVAPVESKPQMDLESLMAEQSGIMMRHVVPSNNSCLFTSVGFILTGGDMESAKSDELRTLIANTVRGDTAKYSDAVLGMPNEEYCAWIRDPMHWGGAIELSILSEHFQVEIIAVDTATLKPHCFGEGKEYRNRIFLIYDGIHYDPLIMELENNTQTMFPASESKPLEMALEIAKEAKSSRQFTDVANFTLLCKVCNLQLTGDKEAREHAKATGHVEFGEI